MARRVSLKGKGADLFFGDQSPGMITAETAADETVPAVARRSNRRVRKSEPAPLPSPSQAAEEPAPTVSDGPADISDSALELQADAASVSNGAAAEPPLNDGELFASMWARLASQASISNSFRYTAPELEEMADALYRVSKDEGARLTKQDIARLGLNVVLWDYRCRGGASWLSEFARRKRRPKEGEHA